jgi:hypothetical protein
MSAFKKPLVPAVQGPRGSKRAHSLREITISPEGRDEIFVVKAPDLSATGMFISTGRKFSEGAVLNLKFRLAITDVDVRTRCEVRYCLPGVGVGVEFIGVPLEAARDIERELALSGEIHQGATKSSARPRVSRQRKRV